MPRPRFFKLEQQKRERILRAAAEALVQNGYDGASLNQIIESAGISKGAVYYYFDDKADLLATVMCDVFDRIASFDSIDVESLDAHTFWPTIERWTLAALAVLAEDPMVMGLGKLFYQVPIQVFEGTVLFDKLAQAKALLEAFMRRGQEVGLIRDDLPLGLLMAVVAGAGEWSDRWMAEHFEELDPEEGLAVSLRLIDMARAMLAPPSEAIPPAAQGEES
ncbi:MAG: TetR/AcrR family transcriptional regulator [Deltaproteobacteria bacterium]|jgi:AcrR family transcriptional regulator|nr:TetR/AcrR family transcriptional regulator [Deltaproteobacteria bacterium]MBW2530520.1 TetR/AcrR family transcriptional regulator [Deltaproteobacteria bacterium]